MSKYEVIPLDNRCPYGQPSSVVDTETRQIIECYKYVSDAVKAKEILEANDSGVFISLPPSQSW